MSGRNCSRLTSSNILSCSSSGSQIKLLIYQPNAAIKPQKSLHFCLGRRKILTIFRPPTLTMCRCKKNSDRLPIVHPHSPCAVHNLCPGGPSPGCWPWRVPALCLQGTWTMACTSLPFSACWWKRWPLWPHQLGLGIVPRPSACPLPCPVSLHSCWLPLAHSWSVQTTILSVYNSWQRARAVTVSMSINSETNSWMMTELCYTLPKQQTTKYHSHSFLDSPAT